MVFSSTTFLFAFLPAVVIIYFLVPKPCKNFIIFASGLLFYAWGERLLAILLLAAVVAAFILGIAIEKTRERLCGRLLLFLLIALSLSVLIYFKYTDFFIQSFNDVFGGSIPLLGIALPIGISFYTFQIISYGVDVYRGEVCAERNLIDLGAYITFFAQLIAGPIVRYKDICSDLKERTHTTEKISGGIRRFAIGLGKKAIIANSLGTLTEIFRSSGQQDVLFYWLYAIAFTLQIYFDFSGYSDMAIGLGSIFGFQLKENFRFPYVAGSVTQFWSRWHISLGSWFRDYVYIPLGGNRKGAARQIINILIVWLLTGFWHGAALNFVIWGLLFAILLILEKFALRRLFNKVRVLGHIFLLFFVVTGFVIFNADSLDMAMHDLMGMFGMLSMPLSSTLSVYYFKSYAFLFVIAIICATPLIPKFVAFVKTKNQGTETLNTVEPLLVAFLIVMSTAFILSGSYNPFLYFRF